MQASDWFTSELHPTATSQSLDLSSLARVLPTAGHAAAWGVLAAGLVQFLFLVRFLFLVQVRLQIPQLPVWLRGLMVRRLTVLRSLGWQIQLR